MCSGNASTSLSEPWQSVRWGEQEGESGKGRIQPCPHCPDPSAHGDAMGLGREKVMSCERNEKGGSVNSISTKADITLLLSKVINKGKAPRAVVKPERIGKQCSLTSAVFKNIRL